MLSRSKPFHFNKLLALAFLSTSATEAKAKKSRENELIFSGGRRGEIKKKRQAIEIMKKNHPKGNNPEILSAPKTHFIHSERNRTNKIEKAQKGRGGKRGG